MVLAASARYVPATHILHADAPVDAANRPEPQTAQLEAPVPDAKLPAAQDTQMEAAEEEYAPATHDAQALVADAPIEPDAVPATHDRHMDAPVNAW